jgi:predicted nucleic acid-binding protein
VVVTQRPWLIDKSALVRLGDCQEQELWATRIERGMVHVTTITLLEACYSARSAGDMGELMDRPPLSLMPVEYLTPAAEKRAVAETARLTVLHVDKDFELIAGITRQETHRLQ